MTLLVSTGLCSN